MRRSWRRSRTTRKRTKRKKETALLLREQGLVVHLEAKPVMLQRRGGQHAPPVPEQNDNLIRQSGKYNFVLYK
jgi:hypothetical protein